MLNLMFAGNVGGEVILREVTVRDETVKVASFNVAVNNGTNAQGDELPPTWIKVSVWRSYADVVAQYVKKGDRVTIAAENIRATAWTGEDGTARSGLEVSARRVDFSGNKRRDTTLDDMPPQVDEIPF